MQPAAPITSFVVVSSYKEKAKGLSARKSNFVDTLVTGVTLQPYVHMRNDKFVATNYGLGSRCEMHNCNNALGNNMYCKYFSSRSAVSLQIKMWEKLIALFDVPYYKREREREITLNDR